MASTKKSKTKKKIETITHEGAKRKNIPTAEYEAVLHEKDKSAIRVAYERRNRDLDPQLVWRGKDDRDWSDLVVHVPPIYIQEKVHPKALIDDLKLQSEKSKPDEGFGEQIDLFSDFNDNEKLSNNYVSDFFQDSYGFLWLATADGLNRYDGKNVKVYKNKSSDDSTIPDNEVHVVLEDSTLFLLLRK